jgi:cystathionine beta-lyase/cystathionine gamma-synthase
VRKTLGTIQTPLGAWLTLQGLKTLPVRLERHSRTALAVASWLEEQPEVRRVLYPGLPSFPQFELARRQGLVREDSGGGLVSFEVEDAPSFSRALRTIRVAENLGAVETLATHPASMTHGDLSPERRRRLGISDGLIRLSVGLESEEELVADLRRGFAALRRSARGTEVRT